MFISASEAPNSAVERRGVSAVHVAARSPELLEPSAMPEEIEG